jgi:formylglycine-generating enzyme required for sulfatase activity
MGDDVPSDGRRSATALADGVDDPFSESPAHGVEVGPFFIGRFELTQAQARRLGWDPRYKIRSDLLPATGMSWLDAERLVSAAGLALPTEAQWEYACRAGTSATFHTGDAPGSLAGFANVRDRSSLAAIPGDEWLGAAALIDDGFPLLAPVGRFAPNRFGLHDVHGNVAEYCRDVFVQRAYKTMRHRPGDGLLECVRGGQSRSCRGGSYSTRAEDAASARRSRMSVHEGSDGVGIRVARPLVSTGG